MNTNEKKENIWNSITFIPFVGWLVGYIRGLKKNSASELVKLSFFFTVATLGSIVLLLFCRIITPFQWRIVDFSLVVIIYIIESAYLLFSLFLIFRSFQGHSVLNNRFHKIIQKINI